MKKFFFTLYCEINLSQIQSYFPLIINSNSRRKTGLFSSFVRHTSQLSGIFHSQTLQINFSVCNLQLLLRKKKGLPDLDFEAAVKKKYSSLYLRITCKRVETTTG